MKFEMTPAEYEIVKKALRIAADHYSLWKTRADDHEYKGMGNSFEKVIDAVNETARQLANQHAMMNKEERKS